MAKKTRRGGLAGRVGIAGRGAAMAVFAMAMAGSAAHGQGGVAGVVRDTDGRELAQAVVVLTPASRQATSDGGGRFEFGRLAAGTYRVEVSLVGYAPASREVSVTGGRMAEVEIVLRPTPLSLPGLQVTASVGGRPPSAVTQATTQLSGRSLDRALAGTVAQTLSGQPGMAVRFNGPGAAMPVLRGLTGDRVLMLQDGQRTGDLAGSAEDHGVTMDALAAQRVEVVRGPATLLYGNNALGGVVNVISGDVTGGVPHRAQFGAALQAESAYPGGAAHVRAAVPLSRSLALSARAGVRHADDMRIGAAAADAPTRLANTHVRNTNGSLALSRVAPSWSGSLAVRGYVFEHGVPAPPGADPVTLEGARLELTGRTELSLPAPVASLLPSARLDFTAQAYGHDELDGAGAFVQRFELGTRTVSALVQQAPRGTFADGAWGVSLLQKSYTASGDDALTPPADSRAMGVFGFQELLTGLGSATLQFGGRFDAYRIDSRDSGKFGAGVARSFDALTGSAGLRVPYGVWTAAFTAARSFRAPTVEELFSGSAHAGTGAVEFGNPVLRSERGVSLEGLVQARSGRLNGQVAAYASRIDDYITLTFQRDTIYGGATLPVYTYTQAPARLSGVEGSLEVALSSHAAAGVRGDWLHAEQEDGTPLSFMPAPRLGASLQWDDGRWSAGADAQHVRAQRRTGSAEETPTDAYTLLRVDGGFRFRHAGQTHALSVRVDNVLDVLYREATSRIRDFAPSPGRNVGLVYRVYF